jgi:chromosome segregation ATPase
MSSNTDSGRDRQIEAIFAEFNESWMNYWSAYVELQNQLYESVKAAREVSWLAATDIEKISEINQAQRELFAAMPRRMDYMPLGQITRNLDSALSKLDELESALAVEKEKSKKLEEAIEALREKTKRTKEELRTIMP